MPVFECERYVVRDEGGQLVGREKSHRVLSPDARVFVQAIEGDARAATREALDRIGVREIIRPGDRVAVKINLGGGIAGVPSSYTEPAICAGVIDAVRAAGGEPFVCEADMRTLTMDEAMLRRRGYLPLLAEFGVPFVNLSAGEIVEFHLRDLELPLALPRVLLDPATRIVSVPSPKHHWECGVTLAQKNMYGAIAERRKSLYHRRGQSMLDRVVAGAARIMRPHLSVVGATQICAGLGPHLCVPVDFDRIIVSNDMLAADAVASDFLGYPFDRVRHAAINLGGDKLAYTLLDDSATINPAARAKIARHRVRPRDTGFWRKALLWTYYVPHRFQYRVIGRLEFLATWVNRLFYAPRGDPPRPRALPG